MPVLSKICPTCGYAVEDETSGTAADSIKLLEGLVFKAKQMPKPQFMTSLRDMLGIVIFLVAIYCLIMAYLTDSVIFKIIGGVFIIVLQYFVGKLVVSWFKPSVKKEFEALKNEYEYHEREARRTFGKNSEVARQLDNVNAEMIEVDDERRRATSSIWKTWAAIGIVFLLVSSGSITLAKLSAVKEAATAEFGEFQRQVNEFIASAENSEYMGDETRLSFVKTMVAAGHTDFAEKFFFGYCQKRMGDLECAQIIVQAHINSGDNDAAAAFVQKAEMRYPSDKNKLQKMLK